MPDTIPRVLTAADLQRHDGRVVIAVGLYQAVPMPMKGKMTRKLPADRAVLTLDDGTMVFLEALESSRCIRDDAERRRYDGQRVRVQGTLHKLMPARGQGLLAPCLSDIAEIRSDGD